jgi:hypothetical protein
MPKSVTNLLPWKEFWWLKTIPIIELAGIHLKDIHCELTEASNGLRVCIWQVHPTHKTTGTNWRRYVWPTPECNRKVWVVNNSNGRSHQQSSKCLPHTPSRLELLPPTIKLGNKYRPPPHRGIAGNSTAHQNTIRHSGNRMERSINHHQQFE